MCVPADQVCAHTKYSGRNCYCCLLSFVSFSCMFVMWKNALQINFKIFFLFKRKPNDRGEQIISSFFNEKEETNWTWIDVHSVYSGIWQKISSGSIREIEVYFHRMMFCLLNLWNIKFCVQATTLNHRFFRSRWIFQLRLFDSAC